MADDHECPECGRGFDSAMGVKVHQGHMRGKVGHSGNRAVRAAGKPKHGPPAPTNIADAPSANPLRKLMGPAPAIRLDERFSGHEYRGTGDGPCRWVDPEGTACGAPEDHRWHEPSAVAPVQEASDG